MGLFLVGSAPEWVCLRCGGTGYGIVHKARESLGCLGVLVGSWYYSFGPMRVGYVDCVGRMLIGDCCI